MSFTVIIPARFASTRLPGKAILDIEGKPMVAHVIDRARESSAHRVIVATDDQRIVDVVNNLNCEVCLTRQDHESGSDRIAEVVTKMAIADDEIVVNVQGDEPLIPSDLIEKVAALLTQNTHAAMATAAMRIETEEEHKNPNAVKVVFNKAHEAMYFSRAEIPYRRDEGEWAAYRHIGIYAYRGEFLKRYHRLQASQMEQFEKLEQLRVLDNGDKIMVEVVEQGAGIGVDTQEDLDTVRQIFASR